MLNKPTQEMSNLYTHLQGAARAAQGGNYEQLCRMALQQNPQLAQRYNLLMQRFNGASPTQVWNTLVQRYGIDVTKLGL
jgi:hypothetical protein